MNIKGLEKIADDPASFEGSLRRTAFEWADKKRFDKRLSDATRNRVSVAFFKIYHWAQNQAIQSRTYVRG